MWFLTLHYFVQPRAAAGGRKVLDEHLAWNFEQQQAGRVLLSGPVTDPRSVLGQAADTNLSDDDRAFVGVMVVRAASRAEAEALLATEPYVRHGYRRVEIHQWDVKQGFGLGPFSAAGIEQSDGERAALTGRASTSTVSWLQRLERGDAETTRP